MGKRARRSRHVAKLGFGSAHRQSDGECNREMTSHPGVNTSRGVSRNASLTPADGVSNALTSEMYRSKVWIRGLLGLVVSSALALGCESSESHGSLIVDPSSGGSGAATGGMGGGSSCVDDDADGFCSNTNSARQDCDDSDPERNPGAQEICNFKDDNCDGNIDENAPAACLLTCAEPKDGCETLTALVAGERHVCALGSSGRVYCWGSNSDGGLGSPELSNSTLPLAVPGVTGATALVGSTGATCAVTDSGAICWGAGSTLPFRVQLPEKTKQIAVADYTIYVLLEDGSVQSRKLLPEKSDSDKFVQLTSTPQLSISASGDVFCMLDAKGNLSSPAINSRFELAIADVTMALVTLDGSVCYTSAGELHCIDESNAGKTIAGNGSAIGVAKSANLACAFAASGKVACWSSGAPTTITDAKQLVVGNDFGCVLRKSGKVSCWGDTTNGTLGDGKVLSSQHEPVDISPGPELNLDQPVLLGSRKLGGCDTLSDVGYFAGNGTSSIHALFPKCVGECQNTLDSAACFASCATNPGLSDGCLDCFAELASCTGADCYADFNSCAGFSVDFLPTVQNAPRFECQGAECMTGAQLGHDCKTGKDCLSGACDSISQFKDHTVCVASDGARCGRAACSCHNGYYCGTCAGQGRVPSTTECLRECGLTSYCEADQKCQPFSNSERMYCQE